MNQSVRSRYSPVVSGLLGLSVADALGVPVEFTSRHQRKRSPVTTMQGYGTYNQPTENVLMSVTRPRSRFSVLVVG
ncbi:MAG: hypothetical protein SAJ12_02675 [Jaaginema sp. PMC 1079.18]|nr:hypothetical protein [Jaaginema sp. PMC 1080.18]MEC4849891.1 hypothetical protein [Jaaginema sp. PMC 1079.18]MEC4866841.1 hypothetical protein [Jaaginema sp. PMC 1078.18]